MSDVRDKLKALLEGQQGLMTGSQWRRQAEEVRERREAGEFEIDAVVPGQAVGEDDFSFYRVRTDYALETLQGSVPLGAIFDALPEHVAFAACDTDLEEFDPARTLFIDTETTGLAGGTGTVAFLVGVGYFDGGVFRLDQCFMRDYPDEEPMLEYLAGLSSRFDTIVSYNGKSFDVPLLRTRFIQNRLPCRLDALLHLDLVHAVRRLWKARLGDCSLGNVERIVLGVDRHGDVPSSEIPEIWLDYVRTRDARRLDRVFYHHRMDILSLVSLTAIIAHMLDGEGGDRFAHAQDRLSVIRLHFRQRNYGDVLDLGRRLLEGESEEALRRQCLELMGLACKRRNDWAQAEELWGLLLQESPHDLLARLELAKLYEHRVRNLIRAAEICEETVQFLETRSALNRMNAASESHLTAFQYRLERIRGKLERGRGNPE